MLQPGDLFAERFSIERLAGKGGMGVVYRAQDLQTKTTVALKIVTAQSGPLLDRFRLESHTLSSLSHPNIVRYIAHGVSIDNTPYLAMEWLEGEELSARIKRGVLSVEEATFILSRMADALAEVHRNGLIHRDIKPSNIFLEETSPHRCAVPPSPLRRGAGGEVSPKLLDFGIARVGAADGLTRTGVIMGTLGYLAPEQSVRGAKGLDASADIFALGCVFFECLVGRPIFTGNNALAILSKILLERAPRLSDHRDDIPEAIDELVAQMLSKEPLERPRNGSILKERLEALSTHTVARRPAGLLTQGELQLFAVVLIDISEATTAQMEPGTTPRKLVEQVQEHAEIFGGRLIHLINGAILLSFSSAESPSEMAIQAARAALAVRELSPQTPISLALGYSEAHRFVGEVIDRAASLVRDVPFLDPLSASLPVRVDEAAARFLEARFVLSSVPGGALLLKERPSDESRTLLGRQTACFGRERELSLLESAYQSCVDDNTTRAILITAMPGVGKSRLLYEFLSRHQSGSPLLVISQGDPMRAGSAFGLVAQALRELCGISDGEPQEEKRNKLEARLALCLQGQDLRRVTEFLGEMLGIPFPDEQSPPLKAARQDALLMSDQLQRAFEDWLRAECAMRPVLLVFEDLHWGDLPSVRLAEAALRLEDLSLMVVGTARPTVHEVFPTLLASRFEELKLPELSKKASERLIREVLQAKASPEVIQMLIERSSGNAFYLEEMLRAVSEGKTELPMTVLAMASARLESLPQEARRTLRAASIFGERAWRGGLTALLQQAELEPMLRLLCEREVLVRRSSVKFVGEEEYRFRHALLKDAAYMMLTSEDKKTGHRLAAEWLEGAGEQDALTLAEHFERGDVLPKAGLYYQRAAEQAFEGNDLEGVLRYVKKGLSCDVTGELRGFLFVLEAEARNWRAEFDAAERAAREALSLLESGELYFRALGEGIVAGGRRGNIEQMCSLVRRLVATPIASPPSLAQASGLARALPRLYRGGQVALALEAMHCLESIAQRVSPQDGKVWSWAKTAALSMAMLDSRYEDWCSIGEELCAANKAIGDIRATLSMASDIGYAYIIVGALELAEQRSRETLQALQKNQLHRLVLNTTATLCFILMLRGKYDEAEAHASQALSSELIQKDPQMLVMLRCFLARNYLAKGDLEAAEAQVELIKPHFQEEFHGVFIANVVGSLRQAQGRYQEALQSIRPYISFGTIMNGLIVEWELKQSFVGLLSICGHHEEAREALTKCKARLESILSKFKTQTYREMFLAKSNISALLTMELTG